MAIRELKHSRAYGYLDAMGVASLLHFATLLLAVDAYAAPIHEVYFYAGGATQDDLAQLTRLSQNATVELVLDDYPQNISLPDWRALASNGATLSILSSYMPTNTDIARLDQIRFKQITIGLDFYPGEQEISRLKKFTTPYALTFSVPYYPRHLEKQMFWALPDDQPVTLIQDYWPQYNQMDVLNLIRQSPRLHVRGSFPAESSLEYLYNIKQLKKVVVEISYNPPAGEWAKLSPFEIEWLSKDWVPSAQALADFATAGASPRRLTVRSDLELTRDERARLENSSLNVTWVKRAL
jgi:hypothetical protein